MMRNRVRLFCRRLKRVSMRSRINLASLVSMASTLAFNSMVRTIRKENCKLILERDQFKALVNLSSDWYWEMDPQLVFTSVSSGIVTLGLNSSEIVGNRLFEISLDVEASDQIAIELNMTERRSFNLEGMLRSPNDGLRWVAISGEPVFSSGTFVGYRGVGKDISDRKQAINKLTDYTKRLEHVATHDALTQLPNRVNLRQKLSASIELAKATKTIVAVCCIDLDGFKPINDTYGHDAGDTLLINVANRFKKCIRSNDAVARLGGDEFVVILTGIDSKREIKKTVMRIMADIASPIMLPGLDTAVSVTASIGVALNQNDDISSDMLLRHADQAMYKAKQLGKNRYHVFDQAENKEKGALSLLQTRFGLALDAGEVMIFYQPKVDMHSGEVIGVEALLRWQHPENGLMPPDSFLPAIENSPLAIRLGFWVIEKALHQAHEWQQQGMPLKISVNIPGQILLHENFAYRVRGLINKFPGITGAMIEMEILESVALENNKAASAAISACRAQGVTFALDDFGTGYASMANLKRMDIDVIKIDQSFVRNMVNTLEDFAIVEGVSRLAIAFGRRVVAEGIETVSHGKILLQLGCQYGQGYGIARPMPAKDIKGWVANWKMPTEWTEQTFIPKEDIPLIGAVVLIRQWSNDVGRSISSTENCHSEQLSFDNQFDNWLKQPVSARFRPHQNFAALCAANESACELREEIQKAFAENKLAMASELYDRLKVKRDRMISLLEGMIQLAPAQGKDEQRNYAGKTAVRHI